jgi:hypothetical protein
MDQTMPGYKPINFFSYDLNAGSYYPIIFLHIADCRFVSLNTASASRQNQQVIHPFWRFSRELSRHAIFKLKRNGY